MIYTNNQLTSKTNYVWDVNAKQFNVASRTDYTYYVKDKIETTTNLIWDGVNAWHNSTKDSLVYDQNNVVIEQFGFNFDDVNSKTWNKAYRYINTINANGQTSLTTQTVWNSKNNAFNIDVDARQITFNYNINNQIETIFDKRYDTLTKQFVDYNETYFYYAKDTINLAKIEVNELNEISVFPNPFNDKVQIQANFDLNQDAKINLINNLGETLNIEIEHTNNQINIYTNSLAKGVYFLHLENKEISYLKKIIKI